MAADTPRWYQNPRIRRYLARSEYITAFTNWFMGLTGRATEIVLYATVLYSSAQLYPHVQLPAGLSLAVFLIQMGALDVGGLSLDKLAKQARADKNIEGADQAARLSQWLIGIMLAGVVTVGLEHALPFTLPDVVTVSIDVALVVARSICAVLYGRVVHTLKTDSAEHEANEVNQQVREQVRNEFTTALTHLRQEFSQQVEQLASELASVRDSVQVQLASELATTRESLQHCQELLASLPALQARLQHLESASVAEAHRQGERPRLRALPATQRENKAAPQATGAEKFDARAFVFACLRENPTLKLAEIEQLARATGQELSQSSISRYRKQFPASYESSTMQVANDHASSSVQVARTLTESSATDERRVVG